MGSIKMKIPFFKVRIMSKLTLSGEEDGVSVGFHNYSKLKKAKLTIIEISNYAIVWCDQLLNKMRNRELPIETWGK